jgi:hypothetical protein
MICDGYENNFLAYLKHQGIFLGFSYNQPKLSATASWSADAITFASQSAIGTSPYGVFVNKNNTVYVAATLNNEILVYFNESATISPSILDFQLEPYSVFVTLNGDIYIDSGKNNQQVIKWSLNTQIIAPVMHVDGECHGLFIDINNTLYCSMSGLHQVVTESLDSISNMITIVAGIGCAGATSYMLDSPQGIFVDINFDLYVADCNNDRIQLFKTDQLNATTIAGNGATNTTTLHCPTAIVLDAENYLFIADSHNNRIIGSGPNGFRCLVGCSRVVGSSSDTLNTPQSMAFDSYGNIFVTDLYNSRIQKFILTNNTLGKCVTKI